MTIIHFPFTSTPKNNSLILQGELDFGIQIFYSRLEIKQM